MKKKERKGSVTRYIQARISSALARKLLLLEWRQYGAEGARSTATNFKYF